MVAAELSVSTVLEGSVQMSGNTVHVNVQLIDARTDRHLWAQSYDRPMMNLFAAERNVAQAIATALNVRLGIDASGKQDAAPTLDVQAYDSMLKGEAHLRTVHSVWMDATEEYHRAAEYSEDAVRRDPSFAQAPGGIGLRLGQWK